MRGERVRQVEAVVRAHGGVLSLKEATAAGLSTDAVRWATGAGVLRRVRQGVYASSRQWDRADPAQRHRLAVLAQQRANPSLVACHASAAVVLGLPTPDGPPSQPQVCTPRARRDRRAGAVLRGFALSPDEVLTLRDGVRVTSAVRTALDCARDWGECWGLAAADAAVAAYEVPPEQLAAAAQRVGHGTGAASARWAGLHARSGAESALESLARATIVRAGHPEPTPQVRLQTQRGLYRVDLLDAANRVITEADGRLKYLTGEDLWAEKLREDALRALGFELVRFTMADFRDPKPWLATYTQALARGRRNLPPETGC